MRGRDAGFLVLTGLTGFTGFGGRAACQSAACNPGNPVNPVKKGPASFGSRRGEIERYLETERAADAIVYGLHASGAALITCFIRDYAGDHVHFVDGSDGGYALAARELKRRWKEREAR